MADSVWARERSMDYLGKQFANGLHTSAKSIIGMEEPTTIYPVSHQFLIRVLARAPLVWFLETIF